VYHESPSRSFGTFEVPDYQFWLAIVATCFTAYSAYKQHQQVALMKAATVQKRKPSTIEPWWKSQRIIVMLCLTAACWIPYFLKTGELPKDPVATWGSNNDTSGQITADGTKLQSFKNHFRLGAIAFHYSGTPDVVDIVTRSKSVTYEIADDARIRLFIPFDPLFLHEWHSENLSGTNYYLLLVPANINMGQFNTLREAAALGVKDIWHGAGPP
jgi:hypothetical protein